MLTIKQDIRITSLILVVILAVMVTAVIAGFAQTENCTVGDETMGYWQQV
jgi:hypothetical protein